MSSLSKKSADYANEVSVLIVDDQESSRMAAKLYCETQLKQLSSSKLKLREAATISEALDFLSRETFHLLLLDRDLGTNNGILVDGIKSIPDILALQPLVQVLMLTSSEDYMAMAEAFRAGAVGYLLKKAEPKYAEYRDEQIKLALAHAIVLQERECLKRGGQSVQVDFVCKSPAMKRLNFQLESLAEFDKPVMFLGATGLGKTAAAKRLHQLRAQFLGQKNRPFFNLNITNIQKDLVQSELFGHDANSFTGAGKDIKQGYFELANDGDIFLDEIGDASAELQNKLLKVIEEREFQRVGGKQTLKTTARVIMATNRNLEEMVAQGTFREDLYMRISALIVELPPLEERKEDLPDIIRITLKQTSQGSDSRKLIYEELPTELIEYWSRPGIQGNIRGIQNDIDKLIVYSPKRPDGTLDLSKWQTTLRLNKRGRPHVSPITGSLSLDHLLHIPTNILGPDFPGLTQIKKILEQKVLEEALRKFPNLTTRAQALKVNPANAHRKYSQMETPAPKPQKIMPKESQHALV